MDEPPAPDVVEDYVRQKLAAAQPGLDIALRAQLGSRRSLADQRSRGDTSRRWPRRAARPVPVRPRGDRRARWGNRLPWPMSARPCISPIVGENGTLICIVQIAVVGIAFPAAQQVVTDADVLPDEFAAILTRPNRWRPGELLTQFRRSTYSCGPPA